MVALISAIAALTPPILSVVVRGDTEQFRNIARWLGPNLVISVSIGGLGWFTLHRLGRYIATRPSPWKWFALVAILLAIAATGLLLSFLILASVGFFPWRVFGEIYFRSLRLACVITLMIGISVFLYETAKHKLAASAKELEEKRQEAERARQMAIEARLESLESRIHPHFLFNTLNSISALIREDPASAERLVERLAALLRFSLDSGHGGLTELRRELKIVVDYLEIERARFGDRLTYSVDVPETIQGVLVPAMSVQTLVENCVKHAISPRREGGRIDVTARESNGFLEIEVADDGPGFSEEGFAKGHGLETLQSRLTAQFGERAQLKVARRDGLTVVSLVMPL